MRAAIWLAALLVSGGAAAGDRDPCFSAPLSAIQSFVAGQAFTLESHTRDPEDQSHLYKYVYRAGEHKQVILITATDEKEPRVSRIAYAWWLTRDRGATLLVATNFMKLVNTIGSGRQWSVADSARFLERVLDWVAATSVPFVDTAHGLDFMGLHTEQVTVLFMIPEGGIIGPERPGLT